MNRNVGSPDLSRMNCMQTVDTYLSQNADRFVAELKDLLRIPSVSADSRRNADTQVAPRPTCCRTSI